VRVTDPDRPRVVLICHAGDRVDREGLAAWLAAAFDLVGIVMLHERRGAMTARVRREIRRVGALRFLDVLAFRLFYRLRHARRDRAWIDRAVAALRRQYPADLEAVPRLEAVSPNTPEVRAFLEGLAPDLAIARCKVILRREIFAIARAGTFVLHPGICPEYRNAHGCFWALARRDLDRVGMTVLRVDEGVDTGPVFLRATAAVDERRESHVVVQYRVVLDNLDAIAAALRSAWRGAAPLPAGGRHSATWGQPWLSAYVRWKLAARRAA
jgi:hypothetical protein